MFLPGLSRDLPRKADSLRLWRTGMTELLIGVGSAQNQVFSQALILGSGWLCANFSVEGIFGYHRLNSIFAGADTNLFQVSSNGKFYFAPSTSSVRPFVNGGVGAYAFNPGSVKFGGNVGGGLLFVITPRFGVQGSYNFHAVNTSGSTFKFSTVQGGVRFVF